MALKSKSEKLADIDKKIAALQEQRTKVEAEPEVSAVAAGQTIDFRFGRGENRKQYSGVVIAEQGGRIKVQYGEGFDTNIVTIGVGDLVVPGAVETPPYASGNATEAEKQAATSVESNAPTQTAAQATEATAVQEAQVNTTSTPQAEPVASVPAQSTVAVGTVSAEALAALGL